MKTIIVPASTANIGPGFDVVGAALQLFLKLSFEKRSSTIIEYRGNGSVPLNPTKNFICKIATLVANSFSKTIPNYYLLIENEIPLARGLGSSGSAVIGGIMLANELLELNFTKQDICDYAVMIEGHPDNVAASLYGTMVTCCCLGPIPKVEPFWYEPFQKVPTKSELFPNQLTLVQSITLNKDIKIICCIPEFELSTEKARKVLPTLYSRQDVIYNLSRSNGLLFALQQSTLHPKIIKELLKDKIHQPFRKSLVPGLEKVLEMNVPGLLGTCLSGAGPTCLGFYTSNETEISNEMKRIFHQQGIECQVILLELDIKGSFVLINSI